MSDAASYRMTDRTTMVKSKGTNNYLQSTTLKTQNWATMSTGKTFK